MKLKIGICDDERLIAESLERLVQECLGELEQEAVTSIFLSGKALIEAGMLPDIIFLDIRMPGQDGYETGRKVRKMNPDCQIIMATCETDRFEEAFEIGAVRYLKKPFEKEKIREALEAVINDKSDILAIELYRDYKKHRIKHKDIKYITAFNGYTEYNVGRNIELRSEMSLNEAEEVLDGRMFVKVHKKYLVNLEHVVRKEDGSVWIENFEVPVSKRRRREFEYAYMEYCIRRNRG